MEYEVTWSKRAEKELKSLPVKTQRRLVTTAIGLGSQPRPAGVTACSGQLKGFLRLRIGDYRLVYAVDDASQAVHIARARHRSSAYS